MILFTFKDSISYHFIDVSISVVITVTQSVSQTIEYTLHHYMYCLFFLNFIDSYKSQDDRNQLNIRPSVILNMNKPSSIAHYPIEILNAQT